MQQLNFGEMKFGCDRKIFDHILLISDSSIMSHNIFSLNFQNDINLFLPSGMVKNQKRIEVDVNKTVYL